MILLTVHVPYSYILYNKSTFLQADFQFTSSASNSTLHDRDYEDTQHTCDVVLARLYGCAAQVVRHKRGAVVHHCVYGQFQPLADR